MSFVLVTIGWVFFRAPTLPAAAHYLGVMFFFGAGKDALPLAIYLTPDFEFYFVIALFFAFAPLDRLSPLRTDRPLLMIQQLGFSVISLCYSSLLLAANSFNPFIYFRF